MTQKSPVTLVRFGAFELDRRRHELRREGVRLVIQEQPLRVLAALLEQPGEIVGRDALAAALWGPDPAIDSERALNKAIHKLREALGDEAEGARFIETVPRRGYRFAASVAQERAPHGVVSPIIRTSILPAQQADVLPYHLALSRDGARLLFLAAGPDGTPLLWLRALARSESTPVPGTERARLPFWSPDGRAFGFFADGKLKVASLETGDVLSLCDARVGMGGTWGANDVILFAPRVAGPLFRIPARGGAPVAVTRIAAEHGAQGHSLPVFADDGRRFLFCVLRSGMHDTLQDGLHAGSLDSNDVISVCPHIRGTVALMGRALLSARGTCLLSRLFDQQRMQFAGDAEVIATDLLEPAEHAFFLRGFAASGTGLIVYPSADDFGWQGTWIEPNGTEVGVLPGRCFRDPAISSDGAQVAFASDEYANGTQFICVQDLARGVRRRLTDAGMESQPAWSPDSKRIAYLSTAGGAWNVWEIAADGSSVPQLIGEASGLPTFAADGRLVVNQIRGQPVLATRGAGEGEFRILGRGVEPQVSPDGRWIAAGQADGAGIMVRALAPAGPVIQISAAGGTQPRWSRDGRQLFFIAKDQNLMAADFSSQHATASTPRTLFCTRIAAHSLAGFQYDVAPDRRFLVNNLPARPRPLTLVCNAVP